MDMRGKLLAGFLVALASPALAAPPLLPDESPAFNDWLCLVQARLIQSAERSHGFPRSARVVVTMLVRPDGSVEDVHAVSSSDSDPRFPALAARVVSLAGPFPPIPLSAHHGDGARINVPLVFRWSPPLHRHRRRA